MRWPKTPVPHFRIKVKFLFLPKRLGNETRWLEHAAIFQERVGDIEWPIYWKSIRWATREDLKCQRQ